MIIAVKLSGAQAEFVSQAIAGGNASAFARNAVLATSAALLGADAPSAPESPSKAGSRVPEARALGLSTAEYRRRCRVLARAGVSEPTPEQVSAVPPSKLRGAKVD